MSRPPPLPALDIRRATLAKGLIVATAIVWTAMLVVGAAVKPGYSHVSQFISELNASGTPWAWQIGAFGFVPVGLAMVVLLVVLAPLLPVRGIGRVGYWLLLMEPLAYIGSALAPCDAGCPLDGSVSQQLHNLLGLLTYLLTTLAVLLLACGCGLRTSARLVLVAAAIVWLVLFAAMIDPALASGRGLLQRAAEVLLYGTLLVLAWRGLPHRAA